MTRELTKRIERRPMTVVIVLAIWYLSLFTPPRMEWADENFMDKWAHLLMYGALAFILWAEDRRARRSPVSVPRLLLLYAAPVAMGGLIELVQKYCTAGTRSGEWLDFAADAVGALLGLALGCVVTRMWLKKGRR